MHLEAKMLDDLTEYLEKAIQNNSDYEKMTKEEKQIFHQEVSKKFDKDHPVEDYY